MSLTRNSDIPGLSDAILGGLTYLVDSHVSCSKDYLLKGHNFFIKKGLENNLQLIPRLRGLSGRIIKESHLEGSWPGFVRFLPGKNSGILQPFFTATDYNLCTTIGTAYSLLFFNDKLLPDDQNFISRILQNTINTAQGFKRGNAYNFWKTHTNPGFTYPYSAPINIPLSVVNLRRSIYERTKLLGLKNFYESDVLMHWIDRIYNLRDNKAGSASIFNIPNDSDNTSMTMGFLIQVHARDASLTSEPDLSPLEMFSQFRDSNRTKADRHNESFGLNTGSYLTWLKDENSYVFAEPETGIIPLSVNNIDIVINSNVLFALSLAGMKTLPGYRDTVKLLATSIEKGLWKEGSLYYPEKMFFPYALSRAVRDAGMDEPEIQRTLPGLLGCLLDEQKAVELKNPKLSGAFTSVNHESIYMNTALALSTLLNLGQSVAETAGLVSRYQTGIEKAVRFLITTRQTDRINHNKTADMLPGITPNYWESGVLYSSSVQLLAHWYSIPHTTSLVVEALTKYYLSYDCLSDPGCQRYANLCRRGAGIRLADF